jgi:hypothetical protein
MGIKKESVSPVNAPGTDQGVDQETTKVKEVQLSPTSPVTQEVISALEIFLELVPPQRVKKHITTLLLLYLAADSDVLDCHKAIAEDLYLLFRFLDQVADALS